MGLKLFLNTTVAKKCLASLIDKEGKVVAQEEDSHPLPTIERLLARTKTKLEDLEEISSHPGPGSFTGLRIGAAVAGALNFALGKKTKSPDLKYD
ncbi:MAG: hypothetical protein Q8O75_03810 [bacterium]|nr:hypothetical protein [bacterium]